MLVGSCGSADEPDETPCPLIGEVDIVADDHGVVALLRDGALVCSGVLATANHVLTAAHCVADTPLDTIELVILPGADDAAKPRRRISEVAYAPESAGGERTDLAVIELDEPVMPPAINTVYVCDRCSVDGRLGYTFGFGIDPDEGLSPDAGGGSVDLVESAEGDDRLDASGSEFTPCRGDSGAPVFASSRAGPVLLGLIERGPGDCDQTASYVRFDGDMVGWLAAQVPNLAVDDCAAPRAPESK